MIIQTRSEFEAWIDYNFPGRQYNLPDSPVWIPEQELPVKCQWFVTVKCVSAVNTYESKQAYWEWCNTHLSGHVRCFYSASDVDQECWGFTEHNDITPWLLKWSA